MSQNLSALLVKPLEPTEAIFPKCGNTTDVLDLPYLEVGTVVPVEGSACSDPTVRVVEAATIW